MSGAATCSCDAQRRLPTTLAKLVEPDNRLAQPAEEAPPADVVAEGLNRIRRADPSFDPSHFIEGARTAFEMIVAAFAKGDKASLAAVAER